MKIGNRTATKRGSDISGCGVTGKVSGSTSEAATQRRRPGAGAATTPTHATTANTSVANSITLMAAIRNGSPAATSK